MTRRWSALPFAAVLVTACFATRNDVRLLQADLSQMRSDAAHADTAQRAQVALLSRQLTATTDSVRALSAFLSRFALDVSRFQGDLATSMHSFGQQLIAMQEQMGQSKKSIADLRADLETKNSELAASAIAPGGAPAAGGSGAVTPLQLLKNAWSQLDGGRYGTARAAFEEFLRQFPTSDSAPDAIYGIAQTHEYEGKLPSADSAYQLVAEKYPASEKAPVALYKRAMMASRGGPTQAARARSLFQQLVDKYPGSPEAELARERVKAPE